MIEESLEQFPQDQTLFSANQPLMDDQTELDDGVNKPKSSKKKVLIGLIIGIVFFSLVLVVLISVYINGNNQVDQPQPTASPTITVNEQEDVVFERLNQIKKDLDAAEPNNQDLPFPPVKMDINLQKNI